MTPERFPHEFHAVGNVVGCKHCHRMEEFVNRDEECQVLLRAEVDALAARVRELEGALAWADEMRREYLALYNRAWQHPPPGTTPGSVRKYDEARALLAGDGT